MLLQPDETTGAGLLAPRPQHQRAREFIGDPPTCGGFNQRSPFNRSAYEPHRRGRDNARRSERDDSTMTRITDETLLVTRADRVDAQDVSAEVIR